MTQAIHAPGAWTLTGNTVRDSNGNAIADLIFGTDEQRAVHGALIAAAPAMLAALRKAQELLQELEAPAHLDEGAALDDEITAILARIDAT